MAEDHSTTGMRREQKKKEVKSKRGWSKKWVRSCFVSFVKGLSWNHQDVVKDDVESRKRRTMMLLQD
jgi:hypothetical protein